MDRSISEKLREQNLSRWNWRLTIFASILPIIGSLAGLELLPSLMPILGAISGLFCLVGAYKVNDALMKSKDSRLELMESRQADRTITNEQRTQFKATLAGIGHIRADVSSVRSSKETVSFTDALVELLRDASFDVVYNTEHRVIGLTGTHIHISDVCPSRDVLLKAFHAIELPADIIHTTNPNYDVLFQIGTKEI